MSKAKRTRAPPSTDSAAPPIFKMLQRVINNPCTSGRYKLIASVPDEKRSFRLLYQYVAQNPHLVDGVANVLEFNVQDKTAILRTGRIGLGDEDYREIRILQIVGANKD